VHATGDTLRWSGAALVGVINVTPDSFSDGGRFEGLEAVMRTVDAWVEGGVWWVDVGGESTRPGAEPVAADEELARVLPAVRVLADRGDVVVSIDTMKPEVARAAVEAGAHVVNDVAGLRDANMRAACAELGVPVIINHMLGEPANMQDRPHYEDVASDVERQLRAARHDALQAGVPSAVIDPGWGFGKTDRHNADLLHALPSLAETGSPVMVGASRKGSLGRWSGEARPEQRLPETLAVHLRAKRLGAALIRAHDPVEHVKAFAVQDRLNDAAAAAVVARPRVALHGLAFFGRHGVFEAERTLGAPFLVDVVMDVDFEGADRIEATVNYGAVYTAVQELVEGEPFQLIESLAEAIADRLMTLDRRVVSLTVVVHKPEAPLPGMFDDVTVEVARHR
jgi:dihydropteroate synthase